jgi:hypothetical protein
MDIPEQVLTLAQAVRGENGRALLVGLPCLAFRGFFAMMLEPCRTNSVMW